MSIQQLDDDTRKAIHRAAREAMKQRLLADILFDLQVCSIEGWGHWEYIDELIQLLKDIRNRQ